MEASEQNGQNGEDQQTDPAGGALEGNDPTQEGAAAQLTDEQKAQAESGNATQGEQGEVPSQDAAPTGQGFDPNAPVRNAPPSPDETRQAAEEGRLTAPDASGQRPEETEPTREGATPEQGEPSE